MFPKPTRIVNKALLEKIKEKGCIVTGQIPCDCHHVSSVGSRGGDTENNLMGLSRELHQLTHLKGMVYMKNTYPEIKDWLNKHKRWDILDRDLL